KKETGLSPIQYMMQRRIGEAQSLLVETSLPIQEIEFRLGFNDSAHFSKMFKKHVGVTPKEYRKHFAGRRRRQYGCKFFTTGEELINDKEIDAVIVTTADAYHAQYVKAAS
ncbi:MAG: helix-turn-helix domain-containing protein, partial [Selenomonadaceae bacterium]|nr:helix-turn-helix domain-containing protein [Selenomonadaceae bacterium]